jgi:aspartyl/asparaginyl beta-hydroxylase (cupin superfamily)
MIGAPQECIRTGLVIDRNVEFAAGKAALDAGDATGARRHFEAIVQGGQADAAVFVALAVACQRLNDPVAVDAAAGRALALDRRNLQALLIRADRLAETGDVRAAAAFYGAALNVAGQSKDLHPALAAAVQRAAENRDRINAGLAEHLGERLAAAGYEPRTSSPRFAQALDLINGRKRIYYQQPRAFYFPELPQVQFYPREQFPWLDAIEAATGDICAELEGALRRGSGFEPYLQSSPAQPAIGDTGLVDKLEWSAYFLVKNGEVVAENAAMCPRTMAILEQAPLPRVKGRDPMVLFSVLKPGVRIPPHSGFLNSRLICHLPLIVPPGCHFRVGNEQREWRKGKAWVFDDSIEHEAWNSSRETRVILLFDIWRPELTVEERGLVAALLEAMDSFGSGLGVEWSA